VLYLVWDAISGEVLFGERKLYRGEDDLVPLLERVKDLGVPVIGIVTDKEKGLVPAVQQVFPTVPYQFCQTHFLKNCGEPLQADLSALQASVRRRADAVRKVGKRLQSLESATATPSTAAPAAVVPAVVAPAAVVPAVAAPPAVTAPAVQIVTSVVPRPVQTTPTSTPQATLTEQELVRACCEMVRVNSKVSGKAPLDPAELKRYQRQEELHAFVEKARKKEARSRPTPAAGR